MTPMISRLFLVILILFEVFHGVESHIKYTMYNMHATGLRDADSGFRGKSDPYVWVTPYASGQSLESQKTAYSMPILFAHTFSCSIM